MAIIVVVLILGVLAITAFASWWGAPWLPTPNSAVATAMEAAGVRSGDVVVDIGAGDGRVLRAAAARGARAVGYELSPLFWGVAWLRTRRLRHHARVKLADAFAVDLSTATVIFAFLRPQTLPRLVTALRLHGPSTGARLVSYAFPIPQAAPRWVVRFPGSLPVYGYDLPLPGGAPSQASMSVRPNS